MPERPSERAGKERLAGYRDPAVYLLLFALCMAAYQGISDDGLFNDDYSWMAKARYEMTWGNIAAFRVVDFFRPMVNLSFYLFERLAPGNIPLQYRTQIVLHFICCVLVYHIFLRVTRSALESAAGAALFAVTSVHTGAVFWISARTTLLSGAFLLGAFLALPRRPAGAARIALSTILFILALLSKETAIAGLPILFLLHILYGGRGALAGVDRKALAAWTAAAAVYLAVRTPLVGFAGRHDWSIGPHMLRNLGGGLLYQLYPWPAGSLLLRTWSRIPEPTHPFLPEAAAVGLAALAWWIGRLSGRPREYILGIGWSVLALIPASAFEYRFFSTVSITQNRYYYVSSAGTVLVLVMTVGLLWRRRSRIARWGAAALLVLLAAGYMVRIGRLERVWEDFTGMYTESVEVIVSAVEKEGDRGRVVLDSPPLAFPYVEHAISLARPGWEVFEAGRDCAGANVPRPFVCVEFEYDGDRVDGMVTRTIE